MNSDFYIASLHEYTNDNLYKAYEELIELFFNSENPQSIPLDTYEKLTYIQFEMALRFRREHNYGR